MRHHACLPPTFWQDAVETSLHIYNRQPMRRLKWKPPVTMWNGTKPNVSYFRTFGCLAYVFIPKDTRKDKLSPKSEVMTFIGYEQGTKGYRFWSQTRMRVVISQNAVFDECFFPHCPKEIQNKPPSNQDLERQQRPDDSSDEDDDDNGHPGLPPQTDSQPDPNVTPRPPTPRGQPPLPPRRTPTPPPPRRIPTPPPQSKRRVRIQTPSPPPRVPTPPVEAPQAPAQRPTWIRPNLPPRPQTLTKNHPKAQIRVQPQRIRKPYVKPGSVYGDKTPVEIERDIRTEKEFVERILKEGLDN